MKLFSDLELKTECLGATVVKWVPVRSVDVGSPELWTFLFSNWQKPGAIRCHGAVRHGLAIKYLHA